MQREQPLDLGSLIESISVTGGVLIRLVYLIPYHVIIFILAHNVYPKKSGQSEAHLSDIYFLDEMIDDDM